MVHCPFPCDVLVMYQPGTLALAPSVTQLGPQGQMANGTICPTQEGYSWDVRAATESLRS